MNGNAQRAVAVVSYLTTTAWRSNKNIAAWEGKRVNGSCAPDDDLTLIDEVASWSDARPRIATSAESHSLGRSGRLLLGRENQMPIKIFFAQGNELIGQLESDINEWRKNLGSRAEVTHIATSATEHKDDAEGWQPRIVVTVWYEL
jgi:hypothetical protein